MKYLLAKHFLVPYMIIFFICSRNIEKKSLLYLYMANKNSGVDILDSFINEYVLFSAFLFSFSTLHPPLFFAIWL